MSLYQHSNDSVKHDTSKGVAPIYATRDQIAERYVISKRKLDKYRELNGNDTENSAMTTVAGFLNVLWIITFGWILALSHLLASIANLFLFFLIITIPNITGHWKMIRIAFMPFNTVIIPKNLANEIDTALAKGKFNL